MKITKPSQLREGVKLKGKYMGVPISGHVAESETGGWYILPHYLFLCNRHTDYIESEFRDLESVEGIRAAKEGDVLVDKSGLECMVLLANDFGAITSYIGDFEDADEYITWERLERGGWKLKGESITMADIASAYQEINIREIQQAVFKDIEDELYKHKFSTEMDGWQIVPQLTATMQILRNKYFKETQGA